MASLINPAPVVHDRRSTHRDKVVQSFAAILWRRQSCRAAVGAHTARLQVRVVSTKEGEREPIDTLEIFEVACAAWWKPCDIVQGKVSKLLMPDSCHRNIKALTVLAAHS